MMYNSYNRNQCVSNENYNQEYSPPQNDDGTPPLPPPPLPPPSQTPPSQGYRDSESSDTQFSSRNNNWDYKDQRSLGQQPSHEQGQMYREENQYQGQSFNERNKYPQRQNYSDRNFPQERSFFERNQPQRQNYLGRSQSPEQSFIGRRQGFLERNQSSPAQSMLERNQSQGQNYMARSQYQGSYVERDYPSREGYSGTDTSRNDYSASGYSQGQGSSERNYSQGQNYSSREGYSQGGQGYSEADPPQTPAYSERDQYQEHGYTSTGNDTQQNYQNQSYQNYNYNNQDSLRTQNSQEYDTSGYSTEQYSGTTASAYDPYDPMQETYSQSTSNAYPDGGGGGGEGGGEGMESNENGTNCEYESPLKALENKRTISEDSWLPKTQFSKKVVNIFDRKTAIPDHRRPPPVSIDPNIPADIAALFKTNDCQLCEVKLNSRVQAKTHYEGKPHAKKVKLTLDKRFGRTEDEESSTSDTAKSSKKPKKDEAPSTSPSEPPKKKKPITDGTQLYCKCCELSFTSTDHATQHYLGRNHHRVLHGLKPLKPGYFNNDTGRWQRSPTDAITPTERLPVTKDADGNSDSELGAEKGSFFCNLCGVAATSSEQLEGHMQGVKHKRLQQIKNKKKKPGSDSILASVIKEKTNRKPKAFSKPKDFSIYRTPSGKFYCSPCDLTLNSEVQFAQHVESKKHKIKKK